MIQKYAQPGGFAESCPGRSADPLLSSLAQAPHASKAPAPRELVRTCRYRDGRRRGGPRDHAATPPPSTPPRSGWSREAPPSPPRANVTTGTQTTDFANSRQLTVTEVRVPTGAVNKQAACHDRRNRDARDERRAGSRRPRCRRQRRAILASLLERLLITAPRQSGDAEAPVPRARGAANPSTGCALRERARHARCLLRPALRDSPC